MSNTRSRWWRFVHNALVHPALEFLPEHIGDWVHDATAKLAFRVPQEVREKVAK